MLLATDIKPRRDGTVTVHGLDGQTYTFAGEAMQCDISHEPTLVHLLRLEGFFPLGEADEDEALRLIGQRAPDEDADATEDDDAQDADPNAPPVETLTEPKPGRKPRKAS